jgi:hypothetical protein
MEAADACVCRTKPLVARCIQDLWGVSARRWKKVGMLEDLKWTAGIFAFTEVYEDLLKKHRSAQRSAAQESRERRLLTSQCLCLRLPAAGEPYLPAK